MVAHYEEDLFKSPYLALEKAEQSIMASQSNITQESEIGGDTRKLEKFVTRYTTWTIRIVELKLQV